MKKKRCILAVLLATVMILGGCGTQVAESQIPTESTYESTVSSEMTSTEETSSTEEDEAKADESSTATSSEESNVKEISSQETSSKESESPKLSTVTMTISEFKNVLAEQPLKVISTQFIVQDERYKSLYPDMLQAVIQNNTGLDIKDAVIAFVAWDSNNLPVKIKGSVDFSDGAYVRQVNYSDINLVSGSTYGNDSGFEIDDTISIDKFEAVCVSYTAFSGETWENPYFDEWITLFEGKKYDELMTVDVVKEESTVSAAASTPSSNTTSSAAPSMDETKLNEELNKQELKIISTQYVVQDERYKSLYPDMLQAVIQNNTTLDIKNAVVAFTAWDSNGLPIKLKGSIDFSDGSYVKQVNYADINLIPGASYGSDGGFEIDDGLNISSFKAIVVSYEAFDGTKWENPFYNDWKNLYEGKTIK